MISRILGTTICLMTHLLAPRITLAHCHRDGGLLSGLVLLRLHDRSNIKHRGDNYHPDALKDQFLIKTTKLFTLDV